MRILLVAPLYPPDTGGCATYFHLLANCLREHREIDEVTVLTSRSPDQSRRIEHKGLTVIRTLPRLPAAKSRAGWILGEMMRVPISFLVTLAVLVSSRADIVHVHKTRSYGGAVLASRLMGRPVIGDVRDMHDLDLFRRSTLLLACGRAAMNKMISKGIPEEMVRYVPIPIDMEEETDPSEMERVRSDTTGGRSYIIYVGVLSRMKGTPELIEGFRSFRRDRKDIDLLLVGSNQMGEGVLEAMEESEGIHYLGPLPHDKVLALIEGASALILPSKFELFPRVCIEGLLMGTKVIFPPCVPEFLAEVPEFTLKEISAEEIERMLEEVLSRGELPSLDVEKHDLNKVCERMVSIYKEIE